MSARNRRRFKTPVISRLTLAWGGALLAGMLVVAAAFYPALTGADRDKISLAVEGVETMARPERALDPSASAGGLRLAAPGATSKTGEQPQSLKPGDDVPDVLAYPEEFPIVERGAENGDLPAINPDEVIITIASGGPVASPVAASLTPVQKAAPIAEPSSALLRSTPWGKIPQVGKDGARAMNAYRAAFESADDQARISLIVGGLGLNAALTERAIDDLPAQVSLSFAPYAKDLAFWTEKARKAGHEVLIELPMEGYGGDPAALGKAGLLSSRTPSENLQRLDWLMSRFGGYFAATNYLGSKFSADTEALAPILSRLRETGVAYIDDTGAASALSRETGAAIAGVDRSFPPAPDESARDAVRRELARLEEIARTRGAAMGKTYAYSVSIDEIAAWAESLDTAVYVLAPASTALPNRYASR